MMHKPAVAALTLLVSAAIACSGTFPSESPPNEAGRPGEELFRSLGCVGCHVEGAGEAAPSLEGVYGAEVHLEGGETVLADEAYLRESILSSEARIVSGYQPKTWRCWPATFGRWRFWRPAA